MLPLLLSRPTDRIFIYNVRFRIELLFDRIMDHEQSLSASGTFGGLSAAP